MQRELKVEGEPTDKAPVVMEQAVAEVLVQVTVRTVQNGILEELSTNTPEAGVQTLEPTAVTFLVPLMAQPCSKLINW